MQKELIVFCALLGVSFAAVAIAPLEPKPEKFKDVEGCYIEKLDTMIPFGEARPSTTECMEYRCGTNLVQYVTCGIARAAPPQELVRHLEWPYPYCCPMLKSDVVPPNSTVETIDTINTI